MREVVRPVFIFAVSGFSKTGKTSAVEALSSFFSSRGHTVATVKDSECAGLAAGDETADTGRHRCAGASASVLLSRGLTSIVYERRLSAAEALNFLNHDIVIMEGFKALRIPKIITASDEAGAEALFCEEAFAFSGKLAEAMSVYRGRSVLNCFTETEKLAALALEYAARDAGYVAAKAGGLY